MILYYDLIQYFPDNHPKMSQSFPSLLNFRITLLCTSPRPTCFTRPRHVVFLDTNFLTLGHRQKQDIGQYMDFLVFLSITKLTHFFNVFFSLLYIFRATQCSSSSSGDSIVSVQHLVYITLCMWLSGMPVPPDRHTRQSPTPSDIYQIMYWYNWFSWWWAQGQQNIKFLVFIGVDLSIFSSVELLLPGGMCFEKARIVHS
jgi:hypothetical protein